MIPGIVTQFAPSVEFEMSILLLVALGGLILALLTKQPPVIAQMLLGIVIGPSVLKLITFTDFVSNLAHVGAVVMLFVIGLEIELDEIFHLKYGVIALFGIIVPWISGYYLARFFAFDIAAAIFVGTALTATSVAVTAALLKEMRLLHTDVANAIFGAAIIDDILVLILLSISGDIIHGAISFLPMILIFVKALLFLILGVLLGWFVLRRLAIRIDTTTVARKFPEFVFVFTMMVAFAYAAVAEFLGLSAIIGAFIAGLSFDAGIGFKHSWHYKEGGKYLFIIFGSIFFVSMGILVDLSALTLTLLGFTLLLSLVGIAAKVIGCGIPARLMGMKPTAAIFIGFGMSPRAEVAMIVALLGLTMGFMGPEIYAVLVLMGVITAILPVPMMRALRGALKK